jgi:hypothetical protein
MKASAAAAPGHGGAGSRPGPGRHQVTVRGAVPDDVATRARDKVLDLADRARGTVSAATVRLTEPVEQTGVRAGRPAVAQVNLTANGRPLRVQTAATTLGEALELAAARLRELMAAVDPLDGHSVPSPPAQPRPDWRRPGLRSSERTVVRRKVYPLMVQTPDEAAATLQTRDYDFHLFTDPESGSDSVIYRGAPDGYLLAQVDPGLPARTATRIPLTVNAIPAPRISLSQARKELATLEAPFLFFADEATGRGNVLYRRYDGNFGLILPAS